MMQETGKTEAVFGDSYGVGEDHTTPNSHSVNSMDRSAAEGAEHV